MAPCHRSKPILSYWGHVSSSEPLQPIIYNPPQINHFGSPDTSLHCPSLPWDTVPLLHSLAMPWTFWSLHLGTQDLCLDLMRHSQLAQLGSSHSYKENILEFHSRAVLAALTAPKLYHRTLPCPDRVWTAKRNVWNLLATEEMASLRQSAVGF